MRILASISITLFYCLFASSGSPLSSSRIKIEKSEASTIYKYLSSSSKRVSKDDDPLQFKNAFNKTPANRFIEGPLSQSALYFSYIVSLHSPRSLRMKSGLSPPA